MDAGGNLRSAAKTSAIGLEVCLLWFGSPAVFSFPSSPYHVQFPSLTYTHT